MIRTLIAAVALTGIVGTSWADTVTLQIENDAGMVTTRDGMTRTECDIAVLLLNKVQQLKITGNVECNYAGGRMISCESVSGTTGDDFHIGEIHGTLQVPSTGLWSMQTFDTATHTSKLTKAQCMVQAGTKP